MAAVFGAASLLALLGGYVVGSEVRGYASSTAMVVFWTAAAIFAGPLLGVSSHWVKAGPQMLVATGAGALSGVLVGEGVYGLAFVLDTTYPPYWWGEIVVGVFLLLAVARRRSLCIRAVALSVGVAALVAVAFVGVYSQELISLLS
jgi:hypothetical protein